MTRFRNILSQIFFLAGAVTIAENLWPQRGGTWVDCFIIWGLGLLLILLAMFVGVEDD